jgi:hypothetical protein
LQPNDGRFNGSDETHGGGGGYRSSGSGGRSGYRAGRSDFRAGYSEERHADGRRQPSYHEWGARPGAEALARQRTSGWRGAGPQQAPPLAQDKYGWGVLAAEQGEEQASESDQSIDSDSVGGSEESEETSNGGSTEGGVEESGSEEAGWEEGSQGGSEEEEEEEEGSEEAAEEEEEEEGSVEAAEQEEEQQEGSEEAEEQEEEEEEEECPALVAEPGRPHAEMEVGAPAPFDDGGLQAAPPFSRYQPLAAQPVAPLPPHLLTLPVQCHPAVAARHALPPHLAAQHMPVAAPRPQPSLPPHLLMRSSSASAPPPMATPYTPVDQRRGQPLQLAQQAQQGLQQGQRSVGPAEPAELADLLSALGVA